MSVIPAGTKLPFTVTFLAMDAPPAGAAPDMPDDVRLEVAKNPPVWFFLALYGAVGRDYEWVDKFDEDPETLRAELAHPDMQMTIASRDGWPQGFFLLDWRMPGICDLAYFGLVPEAVGTGIGAKLLAAAIAAGWARAGVTRMTLNTCSLDHPRALQVYNQAGFRPIRSEDHTRILTRDRDPSRFPA
jgi:GNAT superfamily N-acetyltransferase